MERDLSRRTVVAGAATGISGILGGCSGRIPGSGGGTTTSEDKSIQLNEIEVWNRTDMSHTVEITVLRNEEVVRDETIEMEPNKIDDEDSIVRIRVLQGGYLDPVAEYRIEVDVGDIHQERDIYLEKHDGTCYTSVVEILQRTKPSDLDYYVSISPYPDFCSEGGNNSSQA